MWLSGRLPTAVGFASLFDNTFNNIESGLYILTLILFNLNFQKFVRKSLHHRKLDNVCDADCINNDMQGEFQFCQMFSA